MSGRTYLILIVSLMLLALAGGIAYAGTTGKISGKVMDKTAGEPLVGVNVTLNGTKLGATTNVDGYYVILLVPPGTHTLSARMVGYTPVIVKDVEVRIDQTTPVDIDMTQEAISVSDIIVVAKRNIVKKDVSTSVVAVQQDEITTLPVESVNSIVGLQAGVEDGLVIRGGSADQALVEVDGVTLRDPRDNSPISSVPLSSIQEISVQRGGFNAEYGQVRSGLVNVITKEGDATRYYGGVQYQYTPPQQKYFGMSVYDPNSMWNRPYLDPAVCWVGTENGSWDKYTQRQYPKFIGWNAVSEALLRDTDPTNDLSPAGAQKVWEWQHRRRPDTKLPDYIIDGSVGGPVPFVSSQLGNLRFFSSFRFQKEMLLIPLSRPDYREYAWSVKVNTDPWRNTNLMFMVSGGKSYNVVINADDRQFNDPAWGINGVQFWDPTAYMRTPFQIAEMTNEQRAGRIFTNSWYSEADVRHLSFAGKLTKVLSASTFYEIGVEHLFRQYRAGPIAARDPNFRYEIVPGYFVDESPFGFSPDPQTGIGDPNFFFGGHTSTIRDSSKLYSTTLKADLSSQLTEEHLVKVGVNFTYYNLWLKYGIINEAFGGSNNVSDHWNPYRLSAYVEDKIEALGFIANVGLRLDLSNPNTEWANVSPFDQAYFSSDYLTNPDYPRSKANVDVALSPRLGISHPITEDSKLYFNYGHFKEMPAYEEIFRLGRSPSGAMLNFGDPSLIQAKTVAYELGYDHVLFESFLLQIAAFYNDITDQQGFTQYVSDRKSIGYFMANNNNYEDIRGLEVTVRKTGGDWVRGFVNYTYQVATQGAFGQLTVNEDPSQQKEIDQNTLVLYQQKPIPQPHARASVTFLTREDFGPAAFGMKPFESWSLDILADWKAGEFLTYNPKSLLDVVNNVQVTDYFNIDLRLNKTISFNPVNVTLYMQVRNLLNTQRLSGAGFYDTYDQQYYFESLHLPASNAYDNIPGNDRAGDVRKAGVAYQPIEQVGSVNSLTQADINPAAIYYDRGSRQYMNYVNGAWSAVDPARMQQVLDDKAYIDMPNNTSFNFLNPRQFSFGINLSLNF